MAIVSNSIPLWLAPWRWSTERARLLASRQKHPFDHTHGVDTDGLIYAHPAARGHASGRHNAGYYATAPSLFRGAIELWRATLPAAGYALEDYTLLDIGAGKGRVLMLASEFPFRAIVGVELDPRLARIARKNLRKWIRAHRVRRGLHLRVPQVRIFGAGSVAPPLRIIEADALSVPLPDGPVVLFYFNSFEREMTEMWLARLASLAPARTAPLDLIYIHPEFDALVRQVPGIQPLAQADIPFTESDAAADAFRVFSDACAVYRWAT